MKPSQQRTRIMNPLNYFRRRKPESTNYTVIYKDSRKSYRIRIQAKDVFDAMRAGEDKLKEMGVYHHISDNASIEIREN